jgi:hypothetical protein
MKHSHVLKSDTEYRKKYPVPLPGPQHQVNLPMWEDDTQALEEDEAHSTSYLQDFDFIISKMTDNKTGFNDSLE